MIYEEEQKNTYSVRVKCFNCGLKKRIEVQRGVRVDDSKCPNCGCRSIDKCEDLFEW